MADPNPKIINETNKASEASEANGIIKTNDAKETKDDNDNHQVRRKLEFKSKTERFRTWQDVLNYQSPQKVKRSRDIQKQTPEVLREFQHISRMQKIRREAEEDEQELRQSIQDGWKGYSELRDLIQQLKVTSDTEQREKIIAAIKACEKRLFHLPEYDESEKPFRGFPIDPNSFIWQIYRKMKETVEQLKVCKEEEKRRILIERMKRYQMSLITGSDANENPFTERLLSRFDFNGIYEEEPVKEDNKEDSKEEGCREEGVSFGLDKEPIAGSDLLAQQMEIALAAQQKELDKIRPKDENAQLKERLAALEAELKAESEQRMQAMELLQSYQEEHEILIQHQNATIQKDELIIRRMKQLYTPGYNGGLDASIQLNGGLRGGAASLVDGGSLRPIGSDLSRDPNNLSS